MTCRQTDPSESSWNKRIMFFFETVVALYQIKRCHVFDHYNLVFKNFRSCDLPVCFYLKAVTPVNIRTMVFSVVTPWSLVHKYQSSGSTCFLILRDRSVIYMPCRCRQQVYTQRKRISAIFADDICYSSVVLIFCGIENLISQTGNFWIVLIVQ